MKKPKLESELKPKYLFLMIGVAVSGVLLLPLNLLVTQRFHHDEALYAAWGLTIAAGEDVWLNNTPIDKPPLFLYLVAGAFQLFGVSETTARIPSLAATAVIVLLTYRLGQTLYNQQVGLLAAWLTALSPFTLLFAPTAFTDPLLVALVLAGCLAAANGRAGWAGLFTALAVSAKQQGLFFVPLIFGLLLLNSKFLPPNVAPKNITASSNQEWNLKNRHYALRTTHHASRFTLLFLLTLLPALIWDFTRRQPSAFFQQSLNNYGGLTTDVAGFGERLTGFIDLLQYAAASPILNIIFIIGLPVLLLSPVIRIKRPEFLSAPLLNQTIIDWGLAIFILAFILLHALFSFQVWDRYLLGLIPLLALLLARILWLPWSIFRQNIPITGVSLGLLLFVAACLSRPIQDAINGRYPLGSNSRAVSGIEQVAAYLQGNVGADHTLYHRWLGAHWRFYLWDYPYDLQFWDTPQQLATQAKPGHLIAFPSWRSETEARLALFAAGFRLQELHRAYRPDGSPSIMLYRIEPLGQVEALN